MEMEEKIQQANADPTIFVITPTDNLDDLEDQYFKFSCMPIDDMRMSNDKAVEIYGMTNEELYYKIKASILDKPVFEGFSDGGEKIDLNLLDKSIQDRIENPTPELVEKIEIAISRNTDVTVVLYPYTSVHPFTLEDLEEKWNRYISLPHEHQACCDEEVEELFGTDNTNMYNIEKNILMTIVDAANDKLVTKSVALVNMKNQLIESTTDVLTLTKLKLSALSSNANGNVLDVYESAELSKKVEDALATQDDLTDELPGFTPYLTPLEIEDYFEDDGLSSDASTFLEEYKRALAIGLCEFDGEAYRKHVIDLYAKKENQAHTIDIDEQLVAFGWNPLVEPTDKAFAFAHDRICNYIKENYKFTLIDATKVKVMNEVLVQEDFKDATDALHPVYIILNYTGTAMGNLINFAKHSKYSHACISFNPDLSPMYTYTAPGLTIETLKEYQEKFKDSICKVIVTFVTKTQLDKMKTNLDYYIANREKTKYAIDNIFNILFNRKIKDQYSLKQVCSQFVNQLLTLSNVHIFDKSNNLISPDDFDKSSNPKLYTVFEGYVRNYRPVKTKARIDTLLMKDLGFATKKYELKEAANIIAKTDLIEYLKTLECVESETEANMILAEIHDLVTPDSMLIEAKRIPIQIGPKGIIVELPVKLEEQYQEIHKTLQVYEKEGSIEQMKPELARLWYLNLVAERKIKVKTKRNKVDDVKKIRDTRARIMNDFKKYLKMVLKAEPEFDFAAYFEASRYNDRKMYVDKDTLLYSGKAIATILKSIK